MRKRLFAVALTVALATAMLATTGCTRVRLDEVDGPGGVSVDQVSIARDGAEKLDARIEMPVGEFTLTGGSSDAIDGTFRYSKDWTPRTEYSIESSTGVLRIDQPSLNDIAFPGNRTNEWDLRLASGIPVDLDVELGVGQSELDLRDVDVRRFNALTGVGETTIDLSGVRSNNVTARIESGLGVLTVRVPSGVGVRVMTISEGVGEFSAQGLHAQGDDYVNDAYATSSVKMEISLHRGLGEVVFESVP